MTKCGVDVACHSDLHVVAVIEEIDLEIVAGGCITGLREDRFTDGIVS